MVTYGPWIQGGDITEDTTGCFSHDYRSAGTPDIFYPSGADDSGTVSGAVNTAIGQLEPPESITDGNQNLLIGANVVANISPSKEPPYPFYVNATRGDVGLIVVAYAAISQAKASYPTSISLPPGATGVQLESQTFTAVAAHVDVPLVDRQNGESSVDTPLRVDFFLRAADVPVPELGDLVAQYVTTGGPGPFYYTMSVDVGPSHLSADGRFIIAPVSDLASVNSPAWATTAAAIGTVEAGWRHAGRLLGLNTDSTVNTTWTLTPPRHRFIYGDTTTVGYNRILQRGNDGYGASGGRRVLQGRSMQATNRRGAAIR